MYNDRLLHTFFDLVRVDSETGNEGEFQAMLGNLCKQMGLSVYEDNTKEKTGLGAGNLLCTLERNAHKEPLMFCCHSDTVTPGVNIEPFLSKNGNIYSAGDTILAADNKAGIAVLLEMITQLQEADAPHGKIELVFTVGEEIGLLGANVFDTDLLDSQYAYVLDSAGLVGGVTIASPSMYTISAVFYGTAAHAGVEPEKGNSAIEMAAEAICNLHLGRLDEETTANVGIIKGGAATNIVPYEAMIKAEVRSISDQRCSEVLANILDTLDSVAQKRKGKVKYTVEKHSQGYQLTENCYTMRLATQAFATVGRNICPQISGGASDANIFNARGIETCNLAIGYEKIHTIDEYIPIVEMEKATEVAFYLATHHTSPER